MLDLAERGLLTKDPVTWSIHWMRDTVLNTLATWHFQMCTLYIKHCETRCGVVVTKGILNTSDSIRRTHQMCAWILCRCETTSDVSCVPRTAHVTDDSSPYIVILLRYILLGDVTHGLWQFLCGCLFVSCLLVGILMCWSETQDVRRGNTILIKASENVWNLKVEWIMVEKMTESCFVHIWEIVWC